MTWALTYCWDISLWLHHITSIINNSLVEFILGASGRVFFFSMYWRWMAFIHVPSLVAEWWRFHDITITAKLDESERVDTLVTNQGGWGVEEAGIQQRLHLNCGSSAPIYTKVTIQSIREATPAAICESYVMLCDEVKCRGISTIISL